MFLMLKERKGGVRKQFPGSHVWLITSGYHELSGRRTFSPAPGFVASGISPRLHQDCQRAHRYPRRPRTPRSRRTPDTRHLPRTFRRVALIPGTALR